MNSYIILITGKNLSNIYEYIKTFSSGWWKYMPSSIIARSELSAVQITEKINSEFGKDIEKLFVFKAQGDAAWTAINESGSNWLKRNL